MILNRGHLFDIHCLNIKINRISRKSKAAMVEWWCYSTRIHEILCSNLSVIIHGVTLDKSLTVKLSRMIHLYCVSVSTLDGRGADIAVYKRDNRNGLRVNPNKNRSWPQRAITPCEAIIVITWKSSAKLNESLFYFSATNRFICFYT